MLTDTQNERQVFAEPGVTDTIQESLYWREQTLLIVRIAYRYALANQDWEHPPDYYLKQGEKTYV